MRPRAQAPGQARRLPGSNGADSADEFRLGGNAQQVFFEPGNSTVQPCDPARAALERGSRQIRARVLGQGAELRGDGEPAR